MSGLRIVFLGMEGAFSAPPLAALLEAGHEVRGVVVPRPHCMAGTGPAVRVLSPPTRRPHDLRVWQHDGASTVIGMAWERGIPVFEVGRLAAAETLAALRELGPDVLCVACFPRLLPSALLEIPRHGALNVHPSLLPWYRGPAPLFWVFHDGLEHAGVTVHLMNAQADGGDIVAQAPLVLPDGITYDAAEQLCAEEGGRLLAGALDAIAAGRLERQPQPHGAFPTAPTPGDADFVITPDWPARRAFNFIRGVGAREHAVSLRIAGERYTIREAVAYDSAASPDEPVQRTGQHIRVRCAPGTLTVTVQ